MRHSARTFLLPIASICLSPVLQPARYMISLLDRRGQLILSLSTEGDAANISPRIEMNVSEADLSVFVKA